MEKTKEKKPRADLNPAPIEGDEQAAITRMYEETLKEFKEGSIVAGRVLEVRPTEVLVDIGYKSEGIIPTAEFEVPDQVKAGDKIEVLLERLEDDDGMVCLSKRRAEQQKSWNNVVENCNEGSTLEGTVKGRVKGGLIVDIGVDAFLPGSQVDVLPVRNPDELIGKKLEFKILKINKDRRNVVLSRRELMEERRREQKKKLLTEIQPGQVRKGLVKNITDFGAFVDVGGIDGLLHVTEIGRAHV